jgi:hypothetical protein
MKTIQAAALLSLSVGSMALGQQAVQWKVSDGGNGHWYQVLANQQTTFWQAVCAAAQRGGHLVTVGTSAENAFIRQISLGHFVHFGAYQDPMAPGWSEPSGGWTWVTGEPWAWSGWCPGQPDNSNWSQFFRSGASGLLLLMATAGMTRTACSRSLPGPLVTR